MSRRTPPAGPVTADIEHAEIMLEMIVNDARAANGLSPLQEVTR